MKNILSRVEHTLQKYEMLTPGERVLVACSGGADSVALFHLLRALTPPFQIRLTLLHFDHALRPESSKDSKFVQALARKFRIPFYGGRRKSNPPLRERNLSPEERARKLRYNFFEQAAEKTGIRRIALGHHRDDQAETVLMRLLQGTGPRGLQGIRPVMKRKGFQLVRPLIEVSRSEIREFLKHSSIPYREDATNRSLRFLRNRVRHRLLPLLEKEFNPQVRESLCRLAESMTAESAGLDDWARRSWRSFVRSRKNGTTWLDRNLIRSLPGALQFRLLDQILHALDPASGLDFQSWQRMEEGLRKGRLRMTLPRKLDLVLTPKKLSLKKLR